MGITDFNISLNQWFLNYFTQLPLSPGFNNVIILTEQNKNKNRLCCITQASPKLDFWLINKQLQIVLFPPWICLDYPFGSNNVPPV